MSRGRRADAGPAPLPMACVMGDIDLLTPLGSRGIPAALVADRDDPARFSRYARAFIRRLDHWNEQDAFVQRLLDWASRQGQPPILFYQTDGDVLLVSRHREALRHAFRFVVADEELIETLLDKARFYDLTERLNLRAPATRYMPWEEGPEAAQELGFPLLIKWARRGPDQWVEPGAKAVAVGSRSELDELWTRLAEARRDVVAQQLIEGPESRVESYHAYVDDGGEVVAEFTGAKLRTYPLRFGYTTALTITDAHDVRTEGRRVVERLGLRGVLKVDLKRDDRGHLWLLEVNPRFNLWHHAGAVAGTNLPELVYSDLVGLPRPAMRRARVGVRWCQPFEDRWAARAGGQSTASWALWMLRAECRSGADWVDPKPFLLGSLPSKVRGKVVHALSRRRRNRADAGTGD